jgi:hypothetical protein
MYSGRSENPIKNPDRDKPDGNHSSLQKHLFLSGDDEPLWEEFRSDFVIPFIPLRTKITETRKLHPYICACINSISSEVLDKQTTAIFPSSWTSKQHLALRRSRQQDRRVLDSSMLRSTRFMPSWWLSKRRNGNFRRRQCMPITRLVVSSCIGNLHPIRLRAVTQDRI